MIGIFTGCEKVYIPDIEKQENVIVVDARIISNHDVNYISVFKSKSFTDADGGYPLIPGASVSIFDNNNSEYQLQEEKDGLFKVDFKLNPELEYKIKIAYQGDSYESSFEQVPEQPEIDTIYGIPEVKVIEVGGEKDADDFRKVGGVQLYADFDNDNDLQHFRFTARKTYQFTFPVEIMVMRELIEVTNFAWNTMYPRGVFNLAAPPEYSSSIDIKKHPLFFMEKAAGIKYGQSFAGWILYLYQYSLTKSSYDFYKDLNNQLDADGRLFDPLYVQARSNLKCVNNPDQIILGNFEITSFKERRYFIKFLSDEKGYLIKPIPYFYDIPLDGEQLEIPPDFWEYYTKSYPNE